MSKASENLAQLDRVNQGVQNVESAEDALNRLDPDPGVQVQPETDDEGKAKFGTAEAFATFVVGSVLFGPVGGVILGGAQGIMKRQAEQSILDQMANEQNAITEAVSVFDLQLDEFKAAASSDEDLAKIGVMEAKKTAALEMMRVPSLQEGGLTAFASFENDMIAYSNTQDTQRIAKDANDARLLVELGDKQFNRYTDMQKDYTSTSAAYVETMRFGDLTLRALEGGTPAQIYAARIGFNKTIDANSAVLGEERDALEATGSFEEQSFQAFLKAWNGSESSSKQRRELADATLMTMAAAQRQQSIRETGYTDRLAQDNFPPKYYDDFLKSQSQEIYIPTIEPDAAEIAFNLDQAAKDNQSMAIGDLVDDAKAGIETVTNFANKKEAQIGKFFGDLNPNLKGPPSRGFRPTNDPQ